jgi:hypothetical protein
LFGFVNNSAHAEEVMGGTFIEIFLQSFIETKFQFFSHKHGQPPVKWKRWILERFLKKSHAF